MLPRGELALQCVEPADAQRRHLRRERLREPLQGRTWWRGSSRSRHHETARKVIDHPHVGAVELDCDMLTVAGTDLRIMIDTATPGSEEAERLALITELGTQSLTG